MLFFRNSFSAQEAEVVSSEDRMNKPDFNMRPNFLMNFVHPSPQFVIIIFFSQFFFWFHIQTQGRISFLNSIRTSDCSVDSLIYVHRYYAIRKNGRCSFLSPWRLETTLNRYFPIVLLIFALSPYKIVDCSNAVFLVLLKLLHIPISCGTAHSQNCDIEQGAILWTLQNG